jgi:REP element-mobilizing transposase RayT
MFVSFRVGGPNVLPESTRDIVLKHCLHDHETKAHFHAVVVMPDHVHLLLTPMRSPNGDLHSLIEILQAIKSVSARNVNKALNRRGPLWQEESFDHVLRSNESVVQKREYIRQNPVRRGLVRKPEDYPWLWLEPE